MTLATPHSTRTPAAALQQPRHPLALGVAVGLALAAHAWLLWQAPRAPGPVLGVGAVGAAPRPVRVRQIVLQSPPISIPIPTPTPAQPPATELPQGATSQAGPGPAAATTRSTDVPLAAHASPLPQPEARTALAQPESESASMPAAGQALGLDTEPGPDLTPSPVPWADTPLPVYTTRMPPAATLHYRLRRGRLAGQATLHWQPVGSSYRISLQGQALGAPLVAWASQGEFDDAGVAPVRYSESRRGRELRAANFQRGPARITFSGPAVQHPLVPGAQDRLSWLVQLGAVLAANPGLQQTGAQVAMLVVGSRGDAQAWTFEMLGMEAVQLPDGSVVQALHLHRAPLRPYDTHADVWLDPTRHHLPVRVHLQVRATGEGTDYLLERLELP